jgi:hypothetical protein
MWSGLRRDHCLTDRSRKRRLQQTEIAQIRWSAIARAIKRTGFLALQTRNGHLDGQPRSMVTAWAKVIVERKVRASKAEAEVRFKISPLDWNHRTRSGDEGQARRSLRSLAIRRCRIFVHRICLAESSRERWTSARRQQPRRGGKRHGKRRQATPKHSESEQVRHDKIHVTIFRARADQHDRRTPTRQSNGRRTIMILLCDGSCFGKSL